MAIEDGDPRLTVVIKELFICEIQTQPGSRMSRANIESQFDYMMTKPRLAIRYDFIARAILTALDNMNKPPEPKPDLTGEELWESIVKSSQP